MQKVAHNPDTRPHDAKFPPPSTSTLPSAPSYEALWERILVELISNLRAHPPLETSAMVTALKTKSRAPLREARRVANERFDRALAGALDAVHPNAAGEELIAGLRYLDLPSTAPLLDEAAFGFACGFKDLAVTSIRKLRRGLLDAGREGLRVNQLSGGQAV